MESKPEKNEETAPAEDAPQEIVATGGITLAQVGVRVEKR